MAFSWQSILSYVISKHFHSVTGVKIEVGYKKGCIAGWHLISQHGTKSRAAPSYFSANLQGKNPGALRNAQRLLLKDSVAFCVIFDIELMNFLLICNAHLLLALCSAPSSRHAALCRKPSQDLPELQTFWSHLPQKSAFFSFSVADFQQMLSNMDKAMFPLAGQWGPGVLMGLFFMMDPLCPLRLRVP